MADFPEPTWGTEGQNVLETCPAAEFIRDPNTLTGVFLQFLRSRFYVADNIATPQLKGYLWTDSEDSRIQIEPSYKWDAAVVQLRPSIFIRRDQVSVMSDVAFGSGRHLSHLDSDGRHRGVTFTNLLTGGHTMLCVGQSGSEAEALGAEVLFSIMGFNEPLQREANLGKLSVSGMSPVQKVDENKENWLVQVSLTWRYSHSWTLYQEAPILKKVAFGVSL